MDIPFNASRSHSTDTPPRTQRIVMPAPWETSKQPGVSSIEDFFGRLQVTSPDESSSSAEPPRGMLRVRRSHDLRIDHPQAFPPATTPTDFLLYHDDQPDKAPSALQSSPLATIDERAVLVEEIPSRQQVKRPRHPELSPEPPTKIRTPFQRHPATHQQPDAEEAVLIYCPSPYKLEAELLSGPSLHQSPKASG